MPLKHKILIIFFITFSFIKGTSYIIAQPILEWQAFQNNSSNFIFTMCIDSLGNVFVSGSDVITPNGFITYKYNSAGQLLWLRRFTGGMNFVARPVKIGCDQQGNLYVAAYDESMILIKYSSNGTQLWFRRTYARYLSDMVITPSGFPIITGTALNGSPTNNDILTIKYNQSGDSLWVKEYNSPQNYYDWSHAMDLSTTGDIAITGVIVGGPYPERQIITIKYDSNGVQRWANTYGTIHEFQGEDVAFDYNGNVIVAGQRRDSLSNYILKFFTIKYNADGITDWNKLFIHPMNQTQLPAKIKIDKLNNSLVVGGGVGIDSVNRSNVTIVKYDQNGTQLWYNREGWVDASYPTPIDMELDNGDNIYLISTKVIDYLIGKRISYAWKYNINGAKQWQIFHGGPDTIASGRNVIIDKYYNLYLNGIQANGPNADFVTKKYSQTIGINSISNEVPKSFKIYQNYPNPFNPITNIQFDIPIKSNVSIVVYDVLGKIVEKIVKQELSAGSYKVTFDGSKYSSSIYFYRLVTENYIETKKMILIK